MATSARKPSGTSIKKRPAKKKAAAKKTVAKKAATKKASLKPRSLQRAPSRLRPSPVSPEAQAAAEKELTLERKTVSERYPAGRRPGVPSATAIGDSVLTQSFGRLNVKRVNAFLRQLIMMLDAGMPILKALRSLETRGDDRGVRNMVRGIREHVESGNPLWQAFSREKDFPPVFVNSIKAAEASGTLTTVLGRLVTYREAREMLKKRVRSAMLYPATIALVCFGVLVVIARFVIPQFEEMFRKFDIEITGWTATFMGTADFLASFWWIFVLAVAAVVAFYRFFWVRSPTRRLITDRIWLRVPLIGTIFMRRTVVEFTRSLALMLRSGLPMMTTLELCRDAVGNRAFFEVIQEMRNSVERGEGLEAPLRNAEKQKLIPGVVVDMLVTGEETGTVDKIADQIANAYEEEADLEMAAMNEMIQPVVTLIMGLIVAGIVLSIFAPLVQMIEKISSGGM